MIALSKTSSAEILVSFQLKTRPHSEGINRGEYLLITIT